MPLADLGPDIPGKLLENAQITHYPGGLHYLIPAGQGREYVYLLDGSIIVYQKGNPKIGISADDTAARLPICEANTDEVKVNARKKCRILRFNRYIYDILTTHSDDMSIEVEESGDETHALFVEIYQAYVGGYLKVPSLPGLALRTRKAVSDPNSSAADISRMIQADPAMVGRLIQVVNSAAFKSENQIDDCQMAIMGLSITLSMVLRICIEKSIYRANCPDEKEYDRIMASIDPGGSIEHGP